MQNLSYYLNQLADAWPEKLALSALLAAFASLLNGDAVLVTMLFALVSADFLLGIIQAFKNKSFSYAILKRGIIKYPAYCAYLILASLINNTLNKAFATAWPLLDWFIGYLIITEIISIIKHLEAIGLRVPALLLLLTQGSKTKIETIIKEKLDIPNDHQN